MGRSNMRWLWPLLAWVVAGTDDVDLLEAARISMARQSITNMAAAASTVVLAHGTEYHMCNIPTEKNCPEGEFQKFPLTFQNISGTHRSLELPLPPSKKEGVLLAVLCANLTDFKVAGEGIDFAFVNAIGAIEPPLEKTPTSHFTGFIANSFELENDSKLFHHEVYEVHLFAFPQQDGMKSATLTYSFTSDAPITLCSCRACELPWKCPAGQLQCDGTNIVRCQEESPNTIEGEQNAVEGPDETEQLGNSQIAAVHTAKAVQPSSGVLADPTTPMPEDKKPVVEQWWFWLIIALSVLLVVFLVVCICCAKSRDKTYSSGTDMMDYPRYVAASSDE